MRKERQELISALEKIIKALERIDKAIDNFGISKEDRKR